MTRHSWLKRIWARLKPCPSCKTLAHGRGRHARLHFLRRNVFNVGADRPLVAERIEKSSGAISIELIFNRTLHFGSRCDGLFCEGVDVVDVEHQTDGRSVVMFRAV